LQAHFTILCRPTIWKHAALDISRLLVNNKHSTTNIIDYDRNKQKIHMHVLTVDSIYVSVGDMVKNDGATQKTVLPPFCVVVAAARHSPDSKTASTIC